MSKPLKDAERAKLQNEIHRLKSEAENLKFTNDQLKRENIKTEKMKAFEIERLKKEIKVLTDEKSKLIQQNNNQGKELNEKTSKLVRLQKELTNQKQSAQWNLDGKTAAETRLATLQRDYDQFLKTIKAHPTS